MRKMKRIMSVLACTILVLAATLSVSAEPEAIQRAQGTVVCSASQCSLTATFSRYGKITGYTNSTYAGHDELVEAFYYCKKGHTTVLEVNIGTQSHTLNKYDDLGHTSSASSTHQYWVRCDCGHGQNYYIDCDYNKTGVHKKPF